MQNQIYIISDVHGCFKSLKALINQFPNKENSKIVFVGDLIDRGPSSCEVVKFIMDNNYDCVLGNHEEMFLEFAPSKENEDLSNSKHWLFNCGGEQTLKSYTCKDEYYKQYDFMKTLPLYLEYKDYKTTDNRYLLVSHSAVGKYGIIEIVKIKMILKSFRVIYFIVDIKTLIIKRYSMFLGILFFLHLY